MHTDDKQDPLAELGYEQKDIAPKHIFKASMIFFGFAIASWVVVYAVMHFLGYFNTVADVNSLKSTKIPAEPNPILQTNITAKTDIRDMRQHENEVLSTSGKSLHSPGLVRIPIEQAIKLTAERKGKISTTEPGFQRGTGTSQLERQKPPASNAPTSETGGNR